MNASYEQLFITQIRLFLAWYFNPSRSKDKKKSAPSRSRFFHFDIEIIYGMDSPPLVLALFN